MEKHDVIIIGGGPAGATLAHFLGNYNIETLVIERGEHFRDKTCAGGLPKGIFDILPEGVKSNFPYTSYNLFNVFYKRKLVASAKFDEPFAYGVMRSQFDESLRRGINIHYNERFISFEESKNNIIVKTDKNIYETKLLVGADGIGSIVSVLSGLNKKSKIVIAEEKEIPKIDYGESLNVFLGDFSLGYGWRFDKNNVTSVGAGSLKKYYKRGLSNLVDKTVVPIKVYPISLWDKDLNIFKGRVVLVGEAGSIVDPFNAAGIYHSIYSSKLLAESIKENFDKGSFSFANYVEKLNATIFEEFKYALILSSVFYPMLSLLKSIIFKPHILEFVVNSQNETGYLSYKSVFERFSKSKHIEVKIAMLILKLLKII
ncbi:MAG: FAD-dependent monooxygenase [Caldisericum sp.]|uniref:FAD-dependent monooxygenase n=1 Tax=Caldisericum sp. TaxID=2499687 RepID=UPI003D12FD8A